MSPTDAALRRLLQCMGEELVLTTRRMDGHRAHDEERFARVRGASMSDRLEEAAPWSELADAMRPRR